MPRLRVERLGPIETADVELGDLTVLVGPQATGKSIFLQMLKLVLDAGAIHEEMKQYGQIWQGPSEFLDRYLGEGMGAAARADTAIRFDGADLSLSTLSRPHGRRAKTPRLFYVPAQRVLVLGRGWPRPFSDYGAQDPFMVRDFSETVRQLLELEFDQELFPKAQRLKAEIRGLMTSHIYRDHRLQVDVSGPQKRLVLVGDGQQMLPHMVWSAGQREFTPLLLGLYWLLPAGRVSRRDDYEWVVIEEPESGLHPQAITAVLLTVLDLLSRGYRVCLSTHTPQTLDLVWYLRMWQDVGGSPKQLLKLFGVGQTGPMKDLAESLRGKTTFVHYFDPEQRGTVDISELDPSSRDPELATWGGLTRFAGDVGEAMASLVTRTWADEAGQ